MLKQKRPESRTEIGQTIRTQWENNGEVYSRALAQHNWKNLHKCMYIVIFKNSATASFNTLAMRVH